MDAEKIAKGLTKAQREALMRHQRTYGSTDRGWPQSAHDPSSFNHAGRQLMNMGLIAWTSDPMSSKTVITTAGLAVRDVIAREGGA